MIVPVTLKKLYEHLDNVQKGMLIEAQKTNIYKNPVTKGEFREAILVNELNNRLPTYLELGKGEVIDSKGNRSKEFDIVLNNRLYCPVAFNVEERGIYFAESVAVAFEVKSKLDKKQISDSNGKFVSLQPLERLYTERPNFGFVYSGFFTIFKILEKLIPNLPAPTLGFKDYQKSINSKACEGNPFTTPIQRVLFAFDSISEEKLLRHFNNIALQANFVCVLSEGCYSKDGKGQWVRYAQHKNHFAQLLFYLSCMLNMYFRMQYSCFDFDIGRYF